MGLLTWCLARHFLNNLKESLKEQRSMPNEKPTEMVKNNKNGVTAYCQSENKEIPLGFVVNLNNKIHVLQRQNHDSKQRH